MKNFLLTLLLLINFGVVFSQNTNNRNIKFSDEELALPGKKGACYTLREPNAKHGTYIENMPKVEMLNPYWNYSWGSNIVPTQPNDIEFVPMLWSSTLPLNQQFIDKINSYITNNKIERILTFNEPDKKNQANMSVERALEIWPYLEQFGVPLGSPAPVNPLGRSGNSDPDVSKEQLRWLEVFMKRAEELNYRVDYICVHNYGGANAKNFLKMLDDVHKKYGRPLLVTEFAVADWSAKSVEENRHSPEKVLNFMKEVLPAMESCDYVIGYSWFSFGQQSPVGWVSALFDKNGELTELGEFYANFKGKE